MTLAGQLECKGLHRSVALERFVHDQIDAWAKDTLGEHSHGGHYHVQLEYDSDLQRVSCSVELTIDSAHWTGFELGSGPWSALGSCLQRLELAHRKPEPGDRAWRPASDEIPRAL